MRFLRFDLTRYGPFTDRTIAFDPAARIHLLYGPNEAGKSSALQAIGDFLFGIPPQTPLNFLHDYTQMRLGALIGANGAGQIEMRRRKGAKATLLGADDRPLGDDALAPFLGGADRDLFERVFGLSQESLRRGGDQMLAAGGAIGESLLEAAAGLGDLAQIKHDLDAQADRLYAARRSEKRAVYAAIDRYAAARNEIRDRQVQAKDWQDLLARIAEAEAERDRLAARRQEVGREKARVQRLRRVRPLLKRIDDAETALRSLSALPALPDDFEAVRAEAVRGRDDALRAMEEYARQEASYRAEIESLAVPVSLLDAAPDIERMIRLAGRVADADDDRPKLEARIAELTRELDDDAIRVGIADHESLLKSRPTDSAVAAVRELLTEAALTEAECAAAEAARAKAREERAALGHERERVGVAADPAPLRRRFNGLRALGDEARCLTAGEAELAALERDLAEALARLPIAVGSAERLAALPVPPREAIDRAAAEEERLARAAETLARDVEEKRRGRAETERRLAELAAAGEVPTPEAIRTARLERDRLWRRLRAGIEGHAPQPSTAEPFEAAADRYEAAVARADDLVDRSAAEARRIGEHAAASAALRDLDGQLANLAAKAEALDRERAAATESWRASWAKAGLDPAAPRIMLDWCRQRDAILKLLGELRDKRDAEQQRRRAVAEMLPAAEALWRELKLPQELPPIPLLLAEIEAAIEDLNERWTRARAFAERERAADKALAEAEARAEGARAARGSWERRWAAAVPALRLAPTARISEAAAALAVWERVPDAARGLADLRHRIAGMAADRSGFEAEVGRLVDIHAPNLKDKPAMDAARDLAERLDDARRRRDRRDARETDLADLAERRDKAEAALVHARATLDRLVAETGAADIAALSGLAEKVLERDRLASERDRARQDLSALGDGFSEDYLRAEAAGVDPDALAGEERRLDDEDAALVHALNEASGRLAAAQAERERLERGRGAEHSAQALQCAAAEIATLSAEWARIRAVSIVLSAAIERYRAEHQDPILTRAGEAFSMLTRGAYPGLSVDYGEDDAPRLVGLKSDGRRVPVGGMSEGTRDQLYLALRIAFIERYAARAAPLPFIGDDLLASFDDDRAGAGLEALAELGRTTQVLLFTHHRHLVEIARARLREAVQVVDLAQA